MNYQIVYIATLCITLYVVQTKDNKPTVINFEEMSDKFLDQQFKPNFPHFDQYTVQFQKNYEKGSQEYLRRKQIYENQKNKWEQKYLKGDLTFNVGANQRSDWSAEERQKSKSLKIEEEKGKEDHIQLVQVSQSAGLPTSLDWREKGIVTSIKNQGNCGSCWTFATAAYGESRLIQRGEQSSSIDLSEQYLLSCTPECSCSGGYLEYVFQEAGNGLPLESQYSYNPYGIVSPFICWARNKKSVGFFPKKAYRIKDSQLQSLLQTGPLAISVSAEDWQGYRGGIFKCNSFDQVNHAVLLVGYDESSWIIKNQWGQSWGENGYIRVSKNPLRNCKIGTSAFWMSQSLLNIFHLALLTVAIFLLV